MLSKKSIFLLFLVSILWNCERDDICAEATPTTPRLIIQFNDIADFEASKTVRQLTVIGLDNEGNEVNTLISRANTNEIALPLRIGTEGISNTTRYKLIKDADFDTDNNPATNSNTDIITITYIPEFVFVSRACGFKSIFNALGINSENDDEIWILAEQLNTDNVENENNAHITLFH